MKKTLKYLLIILSIMALTFVSFPVQTALAMKEKADVTIKVKNHTGETVILWLYAANGGVTQFNYEAGVTNTVMPEGRYTYFASTRCGYKTGTFNLNVTKRLDFSCSHGPAIALYSQSNSYCYDVWDFPHLPGSRYQVWTNYGPYCQSQPPEDGDMIRIQVDPGKWDWVEFFESAPFACLADRGAAYYTLDCPK